MPQVFLSYASSDEKTANAIHQYLVAQGINTFKASASLQAGEKWSDSIKANLKASQWVIVLASKAATASAFVNNEIGAASILNKKLVPIVWDQAPENLPPWLKEHQAIDLRQQTSIQHLARNIKAIMAQQRAKQKNGQAAGVLAIVGMALLAILVAL